MRKPTLLERKRTHFVENLNRVKMQCLLTDITQARQNSDSVNKVEVNKICSQISEIFHELANSCNKNNNTSTNLNNHKRSWFGRQCEISLKEYHCAKKRHAKYPSASSNASVNTIKYAE